MLGTLGAALLLAQAPTAGATQQDQYLKLLHRVAPDAVGISNDELLARAKVACVCWSSGPVTFLKPGFVAHVSSNNVTYCVVPAFDTSGTLVSTFGCGDFDVLSK